MPMPVKVAAPANNAKLKDIAATRFPLPIKMIRVKVFKNITKWIKKGKNQTALMQSLA
jgi:hypothetical protein